MNAEPSTSPLPERLAACVQDVLGARPISARRVSHQGCTPTERFILTLPDGKTAFVKAAVNERTAGDLRREYFIYSQVRGPFMPQFLGWRDDGELPILLIENLEDAFWPPPWTSEHIETVRRTLAQVAATPAPPGLNSLEKSRNELSGWRRVADDPAPFLALRLCSARWLEEALPTLLAASDAAVLEGDALLHIDVRSDNLCIRNGQAVLIDWNHAARGNALVDIVGWLPSLHKEGGPDPDKIVGEEAADIAALLAGYWASRRAAACPGCAARAALAVAPIARRAALGRSRAGPTSTESTELTLHLGSFVSSAERRRPRHAKVDTACCCRVAAQVGERRCGFVRIVWMLSCGITSGRCRVAPSGVAFSLVSFPTSGVAGPGDDGRAETR